MLTRERVGDAMHRYVFALLFAALVASAARRLDGQAKDDPFEDAVAAVRAWYRTIGDGSNQADLLQFGTVGSGPQPLREAYQQLAPSLRQQISETQFLTYFQGLAHLKLLQAHPMCEAATVETVRVFVEEERVMAIQGIAAVAWYAGFIAVAHTPAGWKISSLKDVQPEDIISLPLGGHMPWRDDPEAVALVRLDCYSGHAKCKVISKHLSPAPGASEQADINAESATVTVQADSAVYQVDLAKLHSGEWVFLDKRLAG